MKKIKLLFGLIAYMLGNCGAHAQEAGKCFEICVSGEYILDYWAARDGAQVGDTLSIDWSIGGIFKFNTGGGSQDIPLYSNFNTTYTLVDLGANPANIDDPIVGSPDGQVDPLWIMGSFSACQTISLPADAVFNTAWKDGSIHATLTSALTGETRDVTAGQGWSFGTNIDSSHTYTSDPNFTVNEVACPEASSSLLGLVGAASLVLRRRRMA